MRVILEKDNGEEYIEIILSDEEVAKLMKRKLLLKELKKGFSSKPMGVCIRRDNYEGKEEFEEEED